MIRMRTSIAGPGIVLSPGAETDAFSPAEEERLIASGYAEAIQPKTKRTRKPKTEIAVAPPVETAAN